MSALVVDESVEAARRAMEVIWAHVPRGELVEISARRRKKWTSIFGPVEEMLAVGGGPEAARKASVDGADVYVGAVSLAERPAAGRRGGNKLRRSASALWIDLDAVAAGREGEKYFASPEEAARELDRVVDELWGPGASRRVMILHSGWGIQGWWPLEAGISGVDASRLVRRLVEAVQARTGGKHVDRLFDASRLMRAPSSFNWRGGPGLERGTGVVRFAEGAAWSVEELDAVLPALDVPIAGVTGGRLNGTSGGALLDVESLCDRVLTWSDVLVPAGWTCNGIVAGGGVEWARPGKAGERSAVEYKDGEGALTVYSSSAECGLDWGLRGAGARGEGSGAGVISRWRALVALAYGGDRERALEDVWAGVGALGAAWTEEWEVAGEVVGEWVELGRRSVWGPGAVAAQEELNARIAAAKADRGAGRL